MSSGMGKAWKPVSPFTCTKSCTGLEFTSRSYLTKSTLPYLTCYSFSAGQGLDLNTQRDPAYSLNHSRGSSLVKTARYFLPPFSVSSVSSVWKLWNVASASLPVSKTRKKM